MKVMTKKESDFWRDVDNCKRCEDLGNKEVDLCNVHTSQYKSIYMEGVRK